MTILSIDSGLESTGYAILKRQKSDPKYQASGLIKTSSKKTKPNRLLEIHDSIKHLIKVWKPNVIVIEQLFFFKNKKTVIDVSHAQGVVMLLAAEKKIQVEFLTPLQIKQIITGYGNADKKSVQKMLTLIFNLKKEITQDDEVDAIACGLAYCYLNKQLIP